MDRVVLCIIRCEPHVAFEVHRRGQVRDQALCPVVFARLRLVLTARRGFTCFLGLWSQTKRQVRWLLLFIGVLRLHTRRDKLVAQLVFGERPVLCTYHWGCLITSVSFGAVLCLESRAGTTILRLDLSSAVFMLKQGVGKNAVTKFNGLFSLAFLKLKRICGVDRSDRCCDVLVLICECWFMLVEDWAQALARGIHGFWG